MRTRTLTKNGGEILVDAHGEAAKHGALLVAVVPEAKPPSAGLTEQGLAIRKAIGRPFEPGNRAAALRGPSLTRINVDPDAPEERRRVHRKAASLKAKRERELAVQTGVATVSSAVKVELVSWARNTAWAEHFDRAGEPIKAAQLAEKASAHMLKAIAIAEREAESRKKHDVVDLDAALVGGTRQ